MACSRPRPARDVADQAFVAACAAGQTAIAAYLLDAGARLDARGNQGMTGLHEAVWRCDHATARMLIDRGAPLDARNDHGGTVFGFTMWVIRNQSGTGHDWDGLVAMLVAAGAT